MRRALIPVLAVAAALAVLGGCESDEARLIREAGPAAEAAGGPRLDVAFCSKVSRKTGRRSGAGDSFAMEDKARVYAFADFAGLSPDRDYAAHLVWIRPDGRELFRRYAEFRIAAADTGCTAAIRWLDAVNLHDVETEQQVAPTPAVSLDSSLNIGPDRGREPGEYRFRVYLDRRLVREERFTLLPAGA